MKKPRKPKPRRKKQRKGGPLPRAGRKPAQSARPRTQVIHAGLTPAPAATAESKASPYARAAQMRRAIARSLPDVKADDRQALAMLMAPVLVIAMAITGQQVIKPGHIIALFAPPPLRIADVTPVTARRLSPHTLAHSGYAGALRDQVPVHAQPNSTTLHISPLQPAAAYNVNNSVAASAAIQAPIQTHVLAAAPRPALRRKFAVPASDNAQATLLRKQHPLIAPLLPVRLNSTLASSPGGLRTLEPVAASPVRRDGKLSRLAALAHPPPDHIAPGVSADRHTCRAAPETPRITRALPRDAETFGFRLAEAAHARLADFVIYSDAYRRISYPMGDVPAMYGVCTDLIIRAYRQLGVDLQRRVHLARIGSGDRNIDHRRTATLRRFFAKYGVSLPVSTYADDYLPGDIVTYYRPQNRRSRAHIAIVSHKIGPSGRPMIIHNRGWGPQIEDALFVDKITGHYRYAVPAAPKVQRASAPAATAHRPKVTKASFSKTVSRKSHKLPR